MEYGKYIIVEYQGLELPICFASILRHADIAGEMKVISAGEFEVGGEGTKEDERDISVSVFGQSTTLKLKSRIEDAYIILKILRKRYPF